VIAATIYGAPLELVDKEKIERAMPAVLVSAGSGSEQAKTLRRESRASVGPLPSLSMENIF
jgi:hypothetical protein